MDEKLLIKFGGELNQVDANTLINSLASILTIVNEVSVDVSPEHKIDIKINALEKGSFIVNLELITQLIDGAQTLITKNNLEILRDIVAIIGGLYGIRKFLKGKKPKEIKESEKSVILINSNYKNLTIEKNIYNYYHVNVNIGEALNNNFETLNNDPSVDRFQILTTSNDSIFEAAKEDFSELVSQEKFEEILPEEKIIKVRVFLHIFKIVFDFKYKWEFIYRADKINASMIDEDFFNKIDKGEKFSKGDTLEVELEINQIFDNAVNTYLNKSYKVLKVFSHIPRAEQQNLNFTND